MLFDQKYIKYGNANCLYLRNLVKGITTNDSRVYF